MPASAAGSPDGEPATAAAPAAAVAVPVAAEAAEADDGYGGRAQAPTARGRRGCSQQPMRGRSRVYWICCMPRLASPRWLLRGRRGCAAAST